MPWDRISEVGADIAWRGCLIARYNEPMKPKRRTLANGRTARWYRGSSISMRVIRRFARQVAERFQPEKIILFGSYAYGTPHADSDVDILVIMPARNQIDQAVKIRCQAPRRFPMDLLVRTPATMKWRLAEGDLFHTEIVTKGRVLYEKGDKGMGRKGRRRLPNGGTHRVVERTIARSTVLPLPASRRKILEGPS
jgi:predicted nucleotidyltransferase